MSTPLRFLQALGALGGIAVAISMFLVGVDWLNYSAPSVAHFTALVISGSVATLAGLVGKKASPWFGWLAYGILMGSAALAGPLIAAVALTGKLPNDPNVRGVLVASLLLIACALPAVLLARRQARGPNGAI